MIENAIRLLLLSVPAIATITGDRITLGVADQGERRPRIVLSILDQTPEHTFDGGAGFRTGSVQVACLAQTYRAAHDLADAARVALDCYSGTQGTTVIEHLEADGLEDINSEPIEGQAVPTFGKAITIWFMHKD